MKDEDECGRSRYSSFILHPSAFQILYAHASSSRPVRTAQTSFHGKCASRSERPVVSETAESSARPMVRTNNSSPNGCAANARRNSPRAQWAKAVVIPQVTQGMPVSF
jgi:hypothetical protein